MSPSQTDSSLLLQEYAAYLRAHHLRALAAENLRLNRELRTPLLDLFASLSDAELLASGEESMATFLADLEQGRAIERAQETLKLWEEDRLPGVPKESISATDLVLVYAAQKQTLLGFLPDYTSDVGRAVGITQALERHYTQVQEAAFSLYARMQKEAELELAQSWRLLTEAERLAHIGSWEWDLTTDAVQWSDELFVLLGYKPGEVPASLGTFAEMIHPDDRERTNRIWKQTLESDAMLAMDFRLRLPDGTLRTMHSRGSVLRDENGVPLKAVGTVQDVTNQKQAEADLRQRSVELELANAQLRQTDRYKDEFLSVISHELRTPLNFIMGFASILDDELRGPLNDDQHADLQKILTGAERMLRLVTDILDVAKIQAGKLNVEAEPTAFSPLVAETAASMRPLAERKGIRLEIECQAEVTLSMDGRRIGQVLTNLIDNAIKFTEPGGSVTVRTCVHEGMLRTEVTDTGVGIAERDLAQLFRRFQQLDMSATRQAGGTGLGLAISKGIVEAHCGTIGVVSAPGQGSTFWFSLPLENTR